MKRQRPIAKSTGGIRDGEEFAVIPSAGDSVDLLVTGESDGELHGWVAPTGGAALQPRLLSLSYRGPSRLKVRLNETTSELRACYLSRS